MLLALGCQKQVGKDTFFHFAVKNFPNVLFKRLAFADPLKDEVWMHALAPHGITRDKLDDTVFKPVVRPLLQGWGEFKRNAVSPSYWIDRLHESYLQIREEGYIPVITDLRYRNEIDWARQNNGVCIKIHRDTGDSDLHASEQQLADYDGFDYVIDNNSTLEQYEAQVISCIKNILCL